jgi:hypothetical protein
MPKFLELLRLYFTKSTLTQEQQNSLTLDLLVCLIGLYALLWVIDVIIQFRLKSKDVAIEIGKQHGLRRCEVSENVWQKLSEINLILPGEPNSTSITISKIQKTRKFVHERSLCLSKKLLKVIDDILDHQTVCVTDASKKNNRQYLNLLERFRNEFEKT